MSGIVVTDSIVTTAPTDVYPTHDAVYGKGGQRTVADITARNAITSQRSVEGMLVYVQSTGLTYILASDLVTWNVFASGSGGGSSLPIYLEADGLDGEMGPPGPPGAAGSAGSTGSQGPVGPAIYFEAEPGEEGPHGPPGSPGPTGNTGAQGPTGPAVYLEVEVQDGDPGPPGQAGIAGATGAQGPAGPAIFMEAEALDGDMGAPGQPGATGATGSQGPVGPAVYLEVEGQDGDIGPPGAQGPQGATGLPGAVGPAVYLDADQGDQGDIGPPGPIGQVGPTGSQGGIGPAVFLEADQGDPGDAGPPGPVGPTGAQGVQGPVGPAVFLEADAGDVGDIGPPGQQGQQGVAGSTGAQGPAGPAVYLEADALEADWLPVPGGVGPTGATGQTGTQGTPGVSAHFAIDDLSEDVLGTAMSHTNGNAQQLLGFTWGIPGSIGSITPNSGAFSALSCTNQITLNTGAGSGAVVNSTTSGTGGNYGTFVNLSGNVVFGVEGSAVAYIVGATAYDAIFRGKSGIAFSANDGAGMQMRLSSGGLAVSGTLSATSTVSGAGFTSLFASPPAIGSTAANTGAFTTLSATGSFQLTGLTAANTVTTSLYLGSGSLAANIQINTAGGMAIWCYESGGAGWQNGATLDNVGNLTVLKTVNTGGYTVAGLPAAGTAGRRAYVTNALAPTFGANVVGGGAVTIPVFDNGTNWIVG